MLVHRRQGRGFNQITGETTPVSRENSDPLVTTGRRRSAKVEVQLEPPTCSNFFFFIFLRKRVCLFRAKLLTQDVDIFVDRCENWSVEL